MSKESQDIDPFDAVLTKLKAQRDQIDQTIQMIEATRAGILSPGGGAVAAAVASAAVEGPGAFLGMTVADAAVRLLSIRKKPLTNPEVTAAITAGGVVLNSAEPVNTVGSILHRRANTTGDVVRVGKTWGLAEWYPNASRFSKRGKKGEANSEASERE